MIPVQVLLTENELAEEFVSSFQSRRLAEKFFYWFPLSVRAWLALCADGAYRNYVRSRSLIARSAGEVAAFFASGPMEMLSLGSGQGDKDLMLLHALREHGARAAYVPVDSSQALLEMACRGAMDAGIPTQGIKADFTITSHLAALAPEPESPRRLVCLIGNTLGAFDPIGEARALRGLLRPDDLLLVDGELFGAETLAGYDNPLNRRFAWAPLHAVGIGESDGELVFENRNDPRLPGLYLIPKYFHARRTVAALAGGAALEISAGERVDMSHSYKYAPETFFGILGDTGLAVRWQGTSDDGRFLMAVAGVA